jgi:2-methylcitrate dehydratase PrpD
MMGNSRGRDKTAPPATIEAVGSLMNEHDIKPADIERIDIAAARYLINEHEERRPMSLMAAQYSLPFVTGVATVRGPLALIDPDEVWTDVIVDDADILQAAAKVRCYVDRELDAVYERQGHYGDARVTIVTTAGAEHQMLVNDSKGTARNPMSPDEIEAKFRRLCGRAITDGRAQEIVEVVYRLEDLTDVRRLGELLAD